MKSTIDKQKFVNYILHKNAQELAKDCIRWGKNDWADKLLQVKLETAEDDVRSYVLSYVLSDVRSYVLSDVLSELTQEFIEAYIYAGGKRSALNIKKLNTKVLKNIETNGNELEQRNWHTCNTTHCRGGWIVVISKHQELEELIGTEMAASMISLVSTGKIPDFHDYNNAAVLDDIRACALAEKEIA